MTEHCVATIPAGFEALADDGFDDVQADGWALEAFAAERAPVRGSAVTRFAQPTRKARPPQVLLARTAYWWVLAGALVVLALH